MPSTPDKSTLEGYEVCVCGGGSSYKLEVGVLDIKEAWSLVFFFK